MEEKNYRIAGVGVIPEGKYDKVSISGTANANGDLECEELKVSGVGSFTGSVHSNSVSVSGTATFKKNLKGDKIKIAGAARITGDLIGEEAIIDGAIVVKGESNVGNLKLEGVATFSNIYGDKIDLTGKKKIVEVNEIEATNIKLHHVKANRVSGENVYIIGYSNIEVIEYQTKLTLGCNVTVKKIIKL